MVDAMWLIQDREVLSIPNDLCQTRESVLHKRVAAYHTPLLYVISRKILVSYTQSQLMHRHRSKIAKCEEGFNHSR